MSTTVLDLRVAVERLRLTVVEDVPAEGPRPVQELAEIVTDLADLVEAAGEDHERLPRGAYPLLLDAQAWPLFTDLSEVARRRGDGWPGWLDTVWLGLRDLAVLVGQLDRQPASRTDGQGRD